MNHNRKHLILAPKNFPLNQTMTLVTRDSHVMSLYCGGMMQEVPYTLSHIYNLEIWDVPTLCDLAAEQCCY